MVSPGGCGCSRPRRGGSTGPSRGSIWAPRCGGPAGDATAARRSPGLDEAHACGAEPLAERAAEELRASGARPRRRAISGPDALTPSERRGAALAAGGRTNREIAEELFGTMATVETHLTRAYRKLAVTARDGLGRRWPPRDRRLRPTEADRTAAG